MDERASLLPALRRLPERQRSVLVLRYLCDLPDVEIAATLGIAPGTVRSQAMRGLARLRATGAPTDAPTTTANSTTTVDPTTTEVAP